MTTISGFNIITIIITPATTITITITTTHNTIILSYLVFTTAYCLLCAT